MRRMTPPARKSPVRNEAAASTSSRTTRGLIRALANNQKRGGAALRDDVGTIFSQAPLGLFRRKAVLRGVQFQQDGFDFAAGRFEKQRRYPDDHRQFVRLVWEPLGRT